MYKKIIIDKSGGSTLETGLIWALVIILFLFLVGWITDIYSWIQERFESLWEIEMKI